MSFLFKVGGLLTKPIDLFVPDENLAHGLKAGVWGAMAGAAFATGQAQDGAAAALMVGGQVTQAIVDNPQVDAWVETGTQTAGSIISGDPTTIASRVVGAGAGAAIGYAIDGENGAREGVKLGSAIANISMEKLTESAIDSGLRAAGAGGGIAVAAYATRNGTADEQRSAISLGADLGLDLGPASLETAQGAISKAKVGELLEQSAPLTATGGALVAAAVIDAQRDKNGQDPRTFLDALRTANQYGAAVSASLGQVGKELQRDAAQDKATAADPAPETKPKSPDEQKQCVEKPASPEAIKKEQALLVERARLSEELQKAQESLNRYDETFAAKAIAAPLAEAVASTIADETVGATRRRLEERGNRKGLRRSEMAALEQARELQRKLSLVLDLPTSVESTARARLLDPVQATKRALDRVEVKLKDLRPPLKC